jgi:hypothetical protein
MSKRAVAIEVFGRILVLGTRGHASWLMGKRVAVCANMDKAMGEVESITR